MIYTPVSRTNHPKAGFNLSFDIFLLKYIPIKIPITANAVKSNKKFHGIVVVDILPKNPKRELKTIIIKEVATAFFIGNLAVNNKAGIIKNPPPTPTKPVNKPTKTPIKIKLL